MRLLFAIGIAALFGTACVKKPDTATAPAQGTIVKLTTDLGDIRIELYEERSPKSVGSFLSFVDAGLYEGAAFYRVVSPENDNGDPVISVIQGGLLDGDDILPGIEHETTEMTGILHQDGVISLARGAPGTGSGAAFFICIGAQPSLDFGGMRNKDGLGFAAFGKVINGMDVVRQIHAQEAQGQSESPYMEGQILSEYVVIRSAHRD
jgi:peptidyl-prolyl cis-trans isomerase A (cyclophilin A)